MPFADYKDWDDCISKNKDKDNPEAYCGYIKNKVEESTLKPYKSIYEKESLKDACWDGYEAIGFKMKNGKKVPNCVPISENTVPIYLSKDLLEAEYKGREVTLNKPTSGDTKKYKVYVTDPKSGNVKKVEFGDPNMEIKRDNPEARKSFRARHKCDQKKDKTKAGYWSCKLWSTKKVSDIVD